MDITTIGEVLIDLTQRGTEGSIPQFAANPGGAPANLAVAASRLGARTAFIGRVGRDAFGRYLREVLHENGVDTRALVEDEKEPTTLAVVAVDGAGERSFSFYRGPGADTRLCRADVPETLLRESRFVHAGSVSLTAEPSRDATLYALRRAREMGALISYDPNYRPSLWPDEALAIQRMREPLPLTDILKVSEEELPLLAGTADLEEGTAVLARQGIRLIVVTLGAEGAYYRFGEWRGHVPGVPCRVGDTNGAGDTFLGALLCRLSALSSLDSLCEASLRAMVAWANRAASITASRHGAIPAMPTAAEMA